MSKIPEGPWYIMFEKLKDHYEKHGRRIKSSQGMQAAKLSRWVSNQRAFYKRYCDGGRKIECRGMCQERIDMLNSVNFQWVVQAKPQYESQDASQDVSSTETKTNKISSTTETVATASSCPSPVDRSLYEHRGQTEEWEASFEKLIKYKEKYGNTDVSKNFENDPKLGSWVHRQRCGYKKLRLGEKKGRYGMNKERARVLRKLGFKWMSQIRNSKQADSENTKDSGNGNQVDDVAGDKVMGESVEEEVTSIASHNEKKEATSNEKAAKNESIDDSTAKVKNNHISTNDVSKIETYEGRSVAEIILRKYGCYQGSINYQALKSTRDFYCSNSK
mmetsp:Transcript_10640/g.13471  ORF Transcript_10640/g.13471 Transcript_10640/m.13471 type:complete len:332 (-) Transcript_10640:310-1305(-)